MEHFNNLPGAPLPVGAYSQAVLAAGLVFCAGQIGIDPATGKLISGGVEIETRRVLANIDAVLNGSRTSKERIVMTSIFLVDIADAAKVNEIYAAFIGKNSAPARQTFAVKELPMQARVEISVIAAT